MQEARFPGVDQISCGRLGDRAGDHHHQVMEETVSLRHSGAEFLCQAIDLNQRRLIVDLLKKSAIFLGWVLKKKTVGIGCLFQGSFSSLNIIILISIFKLLYFVFRLVCIVCRVCHDDHIAPKMFWRDVIISRHVSTPNIPLRSFRDLFVLFCSKFLEENSKFKSTVAGF